MELRTRLSIYRSVSLILLDTLNIILRSINRYSTTSTSEAAYIIGGYYTKEIISEFKNDAWSELGALKKGRHAHASISLGDETMVIGGFSSDSR